ncbi:MAG TPA: MFS transporter, partial [Hyphomicrobiaceae bacterium]|nr:MFS transporter [Hyphomicrobiaceae bacterium]
MDTRPEPQRAFLATLVALTFVMNLIARGVPETFAVFLLPVQDGLGVARSEVTLTYSCYMLAYGLSAPFVGQLFDRLGARITYGFGLASLGVGYLIAGSASGLWPYLLGAGLLGGLGAAALGMIVASGLLSRWFTSNIGSIMSLPYAALGVGMLILPPLAQLLLSAYGWRTAHHILGAGVLAVLPLAMLLPLGRMTAGSSGWRELRRQAAASVSGGWTVTAAARTGGFWGLFIAYLFTSIAAYAVLPHSVAYLIERGFDPMVAASAFGMTGMLSVVGMLGIGWLSDRIGRRQAATLSFLSTMTGILALIAVSIWPSLLLVYAFVWFFGLMQGARGPIIVALAAALFPGGGVGAIYGTLSMAMGGGAAIGSWASGVLYQSTGGYVASFLLSMTCAFAAMASFWVFRGLRDGEHETGAINHPAPVA